MTEHIDPLTEFLFNEMNEDEVLSEANKLTTISTITKQTKIKKATGQLASVAARKRNDPIYKKMIYFRDQYYNYRTMIHNKYGPRVQSKAKR